MNIADTTVVATVVKIQVEEVPIFAILCLNIEGMSENYKVMKYYEVPNKTSFHVKNPVGNGQIRSSDYCLKLIRNGSAQICLELFQTLVTH